MYNNHILIPEVNVKTFQNEQAQKYTFELTF